MQVTLLEDGPIIIKDVEDQEGNKLDKVALCRCGETENSPFCDGSHLKVNYKAKAVTYSCQDCVCEELNGN